MSSATKSVDGVVGLGSFVMMGAKLPVWMPLTTVALTHGFSGHDGVPVFLGSSLEGARLFPKVTWGTVKGKGRVLAEETLQVQRTVEEVCSSGDIGASMHVHCLEYRNGGYFVVLVNSSESYRLQLMSAEEQAHQLCAIVWHKSTERLSIHGPENDVLTLTPRDEMFALLNYHGILPGNDFPNYASLLTGWYLRGDSRRRRLYQGLFST